VDQSLVNDAEAQILNAKNSDKCADLAAKCKQALDTYKAAVDAFDGSHPNWKKLGWWLVAAAGIGLGVGIAGASFGGATVVGVGVGAASGASANAGINAVNEQQKKLKQDIQDSSDALKKALQDLKNCLA
jgi:hypothetical protein